MYDYYFIIGMIKVVGRREGLSRELMSLENSLRIGYYDKVILKMVDD